MHPLPDDVVVEEVGVEERLHQGGEVQQRVVDVPPIVVRLVHPVEDVKHPVGAQQEHVVPFCCVSG